MAATSDYVMTGATSDELWPLVRDFHYSRRMPSAVTNCFAVREPGGLFGDTGQIVAGCIFGYGANRHWPHHALELCRLVRTDDCVLPLSQLVSFSLRWLRANTETTYVFSYADTEQGHHGGIYQASNFRYIRLSKGNVVYDAPDGKRRHGRTLVGKYGTAAANFILNKHPDWVRTVDGDKHLYVFPLRWKWKRIQSEYGWQELPYPKPDMDAAIKRVEE